MTNHQTTPLHRQPAEGTTWRVLGMPHLLRLGAAENVSGLTMVELDVAPGQGVPPHTHANEDEIFIVLSGAVAFQIEGLPGPVELVPNACLFAPRGRFHGFRNASTEPAKLLITVTPGAGTERMFAELEQASAGLDPADRKAAAAVLFPISARYGVTFLPLAASGG